MELKALFSLSYGLYVVSAQAEGRASGCVANTLAQVTSDPARLSVALNKNNYTTELIRASGRFAAAVLSVEADMNLIAGFGFRSGRDADKFSGGKFLTDAHGLRLPAEGVCARVSCRVVQTVDLGTHVLFVGALEEAEILSTAEPMTYAYYHRVKKGTTPKNAPSYQAESNPQSDRQESSAAASNGTATEDKAAASKAEPAADKTATGTEPAAKNKFRCTVCGYIVEADELPADYKCPICGVGRDKFVRV